MTISYNWIKQYLKIDMPATEVADLLTTIGLEVEGVHTWESLPGGLENVVVGEVLECVPHPNADRLKCTVVQVGVDKLNIVCGAPNVAVGQKVPVALVGAELHPSVGEPITIKKGKIRGEVSEGMICAEDELGIGHNHDGIMILEAKWESGTPMAQVLGLEIDQIFEIGLTPNRSDAMSHYGVARDIKAALKFRGKELELSLPSLSQFKVTDNSRPIKIDIQSTDACYRYIGVSIEGVEVKESPDWIKNRLKAIGLKPINNIVDATNYVLHETGHPLHAFDTDKITGQKIIIRKAQSGEKLTTLDGTERILHEDDLLICNEQAPMVIAGVFGGMDAGVSAQTKNIFIESALFNPVSVRKTAKRHGLNTDASFRYERGVDPNMTLYALKRVANIIREVAGGKVSMEILDEYPVPQEPHFIDIKFSKINSLIGKEISKDEVKQILAGLEIKIMAEIEDKLRVEVPAYRNDVTREADIVEEVLRIYGFDKIDAQGKWNISHSKSEKVSAHRLRYDLGKLLSARGFYEAMNNSLTKQRYYEENQHFPAEKSVEILNPLSRDMSVMRQTLLYGLLENLAYNSNRQREDLALFEFGKVYHKAESTYQEAAHLSLICAGHSIAENWQTADRAYSYFSLMAVVEYLLTKAGITQLTKEYCKYEGLGEGLKILSKNQEIAQVLKLDVSLCKAFDLDQEVYFASIHFEPLLQSAQNTQVKYADLPKFPEVRRDLALLVDKNMTYQTLAEAVDSLRIKTLKNYTLFDVYEGKNLPEGKKSYALSFILNDSNKTLSDKEIDKSMTRIQQALEALGAELRK